MSKANFANLANGSSSRPSAARAGIVKRQALQFVTIPDKASPFRDDGGGDPLARPAKSPLHKTGNRIAAPAFSKGGSLGSDE